MTLTDKTIFNIRLRKTPPMKDVDSRNVSDDDYVFHQPVRTDEKAEQETAIQLLRTKTARLLKPPVPQPDPI